MKYNVWSPVVTSVDRTSFNFQFEDSAFVNNHLLVYWLTIHNSILKICPKFQVVSSHFFEVDELLDEHWAKIVRSEIISTYFAGGEIRQVIYCFFQVIDTNLWLSGLGESQWVWRPGFDCWLNVECWYLLQRLGHFVCTKPVSALTRALFVLLCPLKFVFSWILSVAISRWQSCKS